METKQNMIQEEKILHAANGFFMLFLGILMMAAGIVLAIVGPVLSNQQKVSSGLGIFICVAGILLFIVSIVELCGLKILNPNEALVFALFGKYHGTLVKPGFYWVNPFCTAISPSQGRSTMTVGSNGHASVNIGMKKISLKTMTLDNAKQKVNDELGNPVEIGAVVIWKVVNPTKAVINVENYKNYLSIQCDAIIRNTARMYPYDTNEYGDEKSLRGSSQEIAQIMSKELQEKV